MHLPNQKSIHPFPSHHFGPRLSLSNINKAKLCLTNKPKSPTAVCMIRISTASLSSRFGPKHTNHRFRMVRLELVCTTPSSLQVTLRRRSRCNRERRSEMCGFGGVVHSVTDASISPVRALKRGRRCRGQGIRRKSCGAE